jgi:hypothetical protein
MDQILAANVKGDGTQVAVATAMNAAIQNLLKLQTLDFADASDAASDAQIQELRAQIPPQVLGHYDRLRVRGKKGVALIRNKTCTGCHMQQPIGKITVLMRNEDIQLCDSCGRYLYLPTESEATFVEQVEATKPVAKIPRPRKRKTTAPVAA